MSTVTASEAAQYITFKLGDEIFAIPVAQVREVLGLTDITRMPTAPEYMRGVVNVRGSAIPVVDLRRKLGLPPAEDTANTRIVVLELHLDGETAVAGAIADSVHNVIEFEPGEITGPPRIAMRWRSDVIFGLGRHAGSFIIILDIEKIFASDATALVESASRNEEVTAC